MTREEISNLISPYFSNLRFAEAANLVRAEYVVDQGIVGLYYFEYSDDDISFDIAKFQEEYISSDYYNNKGYLRWNHYLIFIRSEGKVSKGRKKAIERDDIYTRKFVFSKDEVRRFFTYTYSNQQIETDVVSTWKEKLRAVDLDEVYTDSYYTEAIPRFLNNDVLKENIADQNLAAPLQPYLDIQLISNLVLEQGYRTYPRPLRSFDFKRVNLINGVNGSGKTSLLTAIELIIAGRSINDPTHPEPGDSITAVYNNNVEFTDDYTPNDNQKYRTRDVEWYSSSYQTGNELYRTFNRYNYFDSDAAYNLAFDEDKRHITKYLSAIALGPEFGRIQERMLGFEERLKKELKTRERTIQDQEIRIDDANKIIQGISLAADPQALFAIFKTIASEVKWKAVLPLRTDDDISFYEKAYQDAFSVAVLLQQLLDAAKLHSLSAVRTELNKNTEGIALVNAAKSNHLNAKQLTSQSLQAIEQTRKEIDLLTQAKRYFQHPESFSLSQIENDLLVLTSRIDTSQLVVALFTPLSNNLIFNSTDTFLSVKERIQNSHAEATQSLREINLQKEKLKGSINQLQNVISEIKALGQKFVLINPEASACPLCESPFKKSDLLERIERVDVGISENATLKILNDQILKLENDIEKFGSDIKVIEQIERAFSILNSNASYSGNTFVEVYKQLKDVEKNLQNDIAQRDILQAKKMGLEQRGFSTSSLESFKVEFEQLFPKLPFSAISAMEYAEVLQVKEIMLSDLQIMYSDNVAFASACKEKLEEISGSLNIPLLEIDPEKHLNYINGNLNKIIELFRSLGEYFEFEESDDFIDLSARLSKLSSAFESYRKSLSNNSQLQSANDSIASATQLITELKPIVEKIKIALDVLEDILTKDSEENILGDFLKSNETEIEEIFQTLHMPKEFVGIKFDHSTKNLYLYKEDSSQPLPLNKISTGQRSALALSVFLALNRKVKRGPKILLFDDPVTYTDDLNILSFLDYLRELVIKERRQLFFATANKKLAGLFEKKFAFLGDEYKLIILERLD